MKKTFLLLLLLIVSATFLLAQPTTAELKKQMEEAMKKIQEATNDPKLKAAIEEAKKMSLQPANPPTSKDIKNTNTTTRSDNRKLPLKNNLLLSQLPKKTLTRNELAAFLNTLDAQLIQNIKSSSADEVKRIVKQYPNDGEKLSFLAIAAWYKNDAEAALLLAAKAATFSIDNDAALSNCAALFAMAGLANKAIPVLKVLLQRQPNSSTVLNNIGQAYTALGEVDTAILYFGRCIRIAPEHPEANNTAALIAMKKGQTEQAKKYCSQALKGGLTSAAIKTYEHLFNDDDGIGKLIDIEPWKIYPFNEHEFTFPEQCEKVADAANTQQEVAAYASRYRAMAKKHEQGYGAEMRSKADAMNALLAKDPFGNMELTNSWTPFSRRAGYAYHRIVSALVQSNYDLVFKLAKDIQALDLEYGAKKDQLSKNYQKELAACETNGVCQEKARVKHCRAQDELSNQYLPRYAVVNRDYVRTSWRLHKEIFEAFSVYIKKGVRHNTIPFYMQESGRIASLYSNLINGTLLGSGYKIIHPYCDMTEAEMKRIDSLDIKENKNCDFNVEIPAGPFTMVLSCKEFEISGGELLKLKYNKNFESGQSTVYAGVGVLTGIPGFDVGATQYVFICFDKNNQPVDVGTQGDLDFDVKGIVAGDQKISLRASLNTGVSFDPGPLQGLVNVLPYAFK